MEHKEIEHALAFIRERITTASQVRQTHPKATALARANTLVSALTYAHRVGQALLHEAGYYGSLLDAAMQAVENPDAQDLRAAAAWFMLAYVLKCDATESMLSWRRRIGG